MWDERYSAEEYIYGKEPNEFFKSQIDKLPSGKVLFVAEGEGRNAVYAAKKGWKVSAFDTSSEGKKKALKLAEENKVHLDYRVGNLPDLDFKKENFDVAVFIYAHLPANVRSEYHTLIAQLLKPGGIIVFEGFSKNHIENQKKYPQIGGPRDTELLFSKKELENDFPDFKIIKLEETEIELNEGRHHVGKGMVIRFIGQKNEYTTT